jgi:CheY-like chemotaxis protein
MQGSNAAGPAPTVLIAEDEFLLALEIEELLRGMGCRVVGPAAGVSELLLLIERTPCDLAFLDVHLRHDETVYAVVDRLQALKIPFVFMTAYGEEGIDPRYADARVICKPFSEQQIESCLSALVRSRPWQREDGVPLRH